MSAEATIAVIEHAQGSDAEWRLLALLANEANAQGIVSDISTEDLAERMGKTTRGVSGVKSRLKQSGQLVVLEEGGGRGKAATYWIKLPGLSGPTETLKNRVANPEERRQTRKQDSSKAVSSPPPNTPPSSTTTSSSSSSGDPPKSKAAKERQFLALVAECGEFDPKADPAPEAVTDGLELLRTGKKVGSKLVTPAEMATAAACISAFNRCFEWKDSKGSDYGLAANLTSIVERVRERPSWDIPKHVRLVESAWRIRWWERNGGRRPQPNVIFGGKSFENVVQDARDEAAGEAPSAIKKRRYTRG